MAITLAELRELCKRYRLEGASSQSPIMPDARINKHIRRAELAVVRACSDHELFRASALEDASDADVVFPTDFLSEMQAFYRPGGTDDERTALECVFQQTMDWLNPRWKSTPTGTPTKFVITTDQSDGYRLVGKLWPEPSSTITDGLELRYILAPTEMTGDSNTSWINTLVPDFEETLLPFGALSTLTHFEGGSEDDQAAKFQALFQQEVKAYRAALNTIFKPKNER